MKKAFFPDSEILDYVEFYNESHFGVSLNSVELIDKAIQGPSIINTPYWFVDILLKVNTDCLSYVISLLHNNCKKVASIISISMLVVGITRYIHIVDSIDVSTIVQTERNILREFNEYKMTLTSIISSLMSKLSDYNLSVQLPPELTNKLYDILSKIEVNKVGKNDYNRYTSKDKLIQNLEGIEKLSEPEIRRKDSSVTFGNSTSSKKSNEKKLFPREEVKGEPDSESEEQIDTSAVAKINNERIQKPPSLVMNAPPKSFGSLMPPPKKF